MQIFSKSTFLKQHTDSTLTNYDMDKKLSVYLAGGVLVFIKTLT